MIPNGHGGGAAGTRAPHPVRATQIPEARRCLLQIPRENPWRRGASPRPPSLFPARPQYQRPLGLSGDIPVLKGKRQLQEPCASLQHPRQPRAAPRSTTAVPGHPGHPGHTPWVPFPQPPASIKHVPSRLLCLQGPRSVTSHEAATARFLPGAAKAALRHSGKPTNFCSGNRPGASSRRPRWPHTHNGEIEK